ncbi:hypothetical protein K469DRAFT_755399 [Zopfia rhizophila CBS 207.26]|uniref:Heterokaryon incompatibility domain-containing protein n=1 Tax=Zopfia rhizophila CBS 207.26 TaxID=1314779 RepID=A0A6A6DES9_9PEZI|nr:hypothetical protein K469DRAFT_755399 [Zopfia rhizophila CBS 207.26]
MGLSRRRQLIPPAASRSTPCTFVMLNRSTSLISLATIDPDIERYRGDWNDDALPLAIGAVHIQAEAESSLCERCQNFDIQSFTRSPNRRKGYLLKDVETAANQCCKFCGLLLDAVKNVEKPEYFYLNAFVGRTTINPDLYVHITISESYKDDALATPTPGLQANRFLIKLGDRFSGVRSQSKHEICITADPAPKMAQYYQFSVFTLAGTAEDMSGGLLQPYTKDAVLWSSKLVRLPYRDKTNTITGNFYAYRRRVPLLNEYINQVRSSILFRRGWILQEWLLSKRLLWYTPHGLFFKCQQELPRSYDQSQLTFTRAGSELQAHLQLKASFHVSNSDILGFWYHALEVYSGQHLTKPDLDRILAVAGLAKEVRLILANPKRLPSLDNETQHEVYVAGL